VPSTTLPWETTALVFSLTIQLDLATKGLLNVAPVHQSISPRHSCFRIITESEVVFASCGSQEELDRWVTGLTDCHSPNRNHVRRVDSQLSVWILEARSLHPKKKYYCEVSLNGVLYSRTCCKMMNDILFWGEPFVFEDLPRLGSVTVKVCRENYNKKKKERSDTDIGKIEIPAILLQNGQLSEQWHQIATAPPAGSKGASSSTRPSEIPSIRIKLQYKTVSIMPLKVYDDFLQYLKTDYGTMCEVLEPVIPAKAKDDIATTLVRILQREGKAREFICDVIMSEVQAVENENLIFRGNTFATKAVDTYMKMVGITYLRDALAPFVHMMMDDSWEEECEVDPTRLSSSASLPQNQASLTALVARAWGDILKSFNKFPS
jgi:RAS protein activator-like 2